VSRDAERGRTPRSVDAEGRLRILYDVATAVGAERKVDGLVRVMGDVLRRTFAHEFMDLVLEDAEPGMLRVYALVVPEGLSGGPLHAGYTFPAAGSVQGDVIRDGRPFVIDTQAELDAAPIRKEERELARRAGLRTACILPLVSRGRTIGTVGFLSTREGVFDDATVELLGLVARQLAPAVDNALAYERLEALAEQLQRQKGYL
jgi:formate hydrogenlyase transcriptional activator